MYEKIYLKAFGNSLEAKRNDMDSRDYLKQVVFYCIKYILHKQKPSNFEEARQDFEMHSTLKQMIELLTPNEFINIFPVKKEYDGEKFELKDYYYTMQYVEKLNKDKPIKNALSFLSEYWNDDIRKLNMEMLMNVSYLRELQGKPSVAEEWAKMNEIVTYTKKKDSKGQQFLLSSEGKTKKIKPTKPNHLKLVK